MANTATQHQIDFINVLKSERFVPSALIQTMRTMWNNRLFTDKVADGFIQAMSQFDANQEIVTSHNQLIGYHSLNNNVYRVYRSKTGSLYVKKLVVNDKGVAKMEYVSFNTIRKLNQSTMMILEAAYRVEKMINTTVR